MHLMAAKLYTLHSSNGKRYRYLACFCLVITYQQMGGLVPMWQQWAHSDLGTLLFIDDNEYEPLVITIVLVK